MIIDYIFCEPLIGQAGILSCLFKVTIFIMLIHSVSPRFWFIMDFIMIYLFVHDDSLTS